ncbi:MAG: histidine ammonia-lyase [Acidobacteria bacterium]|nr:histidine ammonia-lyase [Acidobacteriota bacterium]
MPQPDPSVVLLDGHSLSLTQLATLASGHGNARLARAARRRMSAARQVVDRRASGDVPVYGVNTGFGHLASVRVPVDRLEDLQCNLVRSHCAGVGQPLARAQVRATMLLRANALARGHSGIRPETVDTLLAMLNHGIHPRILAQGSVGASGDLAPLACLALALMGEGEVEMGGQELPAALAFSQAGLAPVRLAAKEGLALINGTQVSTAIGALALLEARRLVTMADLAGAMSLEALKGSARPFDAAVQEARRHNGPELSAGNLRRLLAQSEIAASHEDCDRVQDSYALRCMPQVHGAVRDALSYVENVLTLEANASTDNPLVFAERDEMISCGNFHGAPVGYAMDLMAIVMADLASISERRMERLVNPALSGLPAFLTPDPGLHSGLMLAQVTAASLVSENKTLAHPASVDSIPTSGDMEDHVSMCTWAARKAAQVVANCHTVLAIETLAAGQALEFLAPLKPGKGVAAALAALRQHVPALVQDRTLTPLIEQTRDLLGEGTLVAAAGAASGELS